ncbi:HAD family hydrolase [Aeromicrobium wangtongii]|uniref:Cof-type HAD-IIB family hydrolase n=1 Tax=Aeromicrobium wangtongii TaxID=2969247 RepID=A0ABY5M4U8_9ACTN|nr:HAD family hydrolase [Aeromicrobium wangtongii]MCD9198469.1 Cof-type HAD-IIB family hydrolase [Aeromicrobium wangtongii]UUP12497.1 Cof-type HAD-IIB family hydrolase [Aeromicrobium wangtongii]
MPPRPRVVATDLDGTLLRSDGSLSPRTRAAIAAAEAAGVPTLFVTARPPRWLDELADAVGGHGVAICGNGSFVYDVAAREVVASRGHDDTMMAALVADLRRAVPGIVFAVERADGMGAERHFLYDHERADAHAVGTFEQITTGPVGKLLARLPGAEPQAFLAQVAELVAGRVELGYSGAVGLAEMTAPGVTKASGLATWCAEHAIAAAEVWACGDMPNDLPMLAWAGRSFAVGNAHPDVLTAASDVIGSNDDDAVAQLLESLV